MTTPDTAPVPTVPAAPRSQVPLLLGAVFLAYLAQMTLNPIIAPLSREVGLAEWQIGVTISVAAVMIVLTSQFWGRRSQSWDASPCWSSRSLSPWSRWPSSRSPHSGG